MSFTRLRTLALGASLLLVAACSNTSSRSVASDSSSTTSSTLVGDTTTSVPDSATTTAVPDTTTAATPAPTNAPATNPPATSPPASGPQIVSATFTGPSSCPSPDVSISLPPQTVSISWVATGADSVYVAIDNAYGLWEQDLPLTGSISDLPFGCPGSHTYYVVAVKGSQLDIEQKTFTAN